MVQRPRRKMHLASRHDAGAWVTVCDRYVAADAAVTPLEDQATVTAHADQVCVHCHRLLLMAAAVAHIAHLLPQMPAPEQQPAERLAPVTPIRRTA